MPKRERRRHHKRVRQQISSLDKFCSRTLTWPAITVSDKAVSQDLEQSLRNCDSNYLKTRRYFTPTKPHIMDSVASRSIEGLTRCLSLKKNRTTQAGENNVLLEGDHVRATQRWGVWL
jgi:hypothetical protein